MSSTETLPACATEGLPLSRATPPGWAERATRDLDALLIDHAHCEMKAAATGFRLLGSYPEKSALVDAMLVLVREEMRHFERVRALLDQRGLKLGKSLPDRYVKRLRREAHRGTSPALQLVDKLIICAFVEARSCERFRLLARFPLEAELHELYLELALAEARHHQVFLDLARGIAEAPIASRVQEIAAVEGEIIASLPALSAIH